MEASVSADQALKNLHKVDHIVVLMMENRSFDHMLGYLKRDGVVAEVEGLEDGMGNEDASGAFHEVAPIGKRQIDVKALDPGHGAGDVKKQLAYSNGGFLRNFVDAFERAKKKHPVPKNFVFDPTLVLAYQTAETVPVYDYLARNYQVCDHWFSSVPGPTWVNRLFAATGGVGPPVLKRNWPVYDRPSFVRHLDAEDVPWRWYSHDPGTLRLIDSEYRIGHDRNFAYYNRKTLFERQTFLDDARENKLPAVSWVDPNFVDFRLAGPPGSNDDHPPSHVMSGQEFVLTLLQAVMSSKQWKKTLLLITYDEHGGFYDHLPPEKPPGENRTYGVRVPALVVGPHVEPGVCKTTFDHTSIIKTILLRFCERSEEALAAMGQRTVDANHLGELLTRPQQRPRPAMSAEDLDPLIKKVAAWRRAAYKETLLEKPTLGETVFEILTDLQREIVHGAVELRERGVQPGHP